MMTMFAEMYMNNLTIEQFNGMALENGIKLNKDELNFSFNFVKTNWRELLANKDDFDFSIYKDKFSKENYEKILQLIEVLKSKYGHFF